MARFKEQACAAKEALSVRNIESADIFIEGFGMIFDGSIEKVEFEEICADIWVTMLEPIGAALDQASLTKDDISQIIVVGGSSRILKVR